MINVTMNQLKEFVMQCRTTTVNECQVFGHTDGKSFTITIIDGVERVELWLSSSERLTHADIYCPFEESWIVELFEFAKQWASEDYYTRGQHYFNSLAPREAPSWAQLTTNAAD